MVANLDPTTQSLFQSRLRLRDDLVFVPQHYQNKLYYHVENKTSGEFYRIGLSEYLFISQLDGETTFSEALQVASQQSSCRPLSQPDAISVYQWLIQVGLGKIHDQPSTTNDTVASANQQNRWNPFWIKIPLLNPDTFVSGCYKRLKWCFSFRMVSACILLAIVAINLLAVNLDRFLASSHVVFSPWNWIWLFAIWIGLKVFHELAHAIVCKHYGGEIRECGLIFILFAPMAYVDVTSSWRFESRWQRIHVAIAGVCLEVLIAAIGVIGWSVTESPLVSHLFYNLVVIASISTLLFNLNPLMKFDGYYILSDLLQIPNLYNQAAKFTRESTRRIFFGDPVSSSHEVGLTWLAIRIYGILAACWRVMVSVGLLLVASTLFHGAGILLAILALISWYGQPLKKSIAEIGTRLRENTLSAYRAILVCGLMAGTCIAAYFWIPSPIMVTSPGIVDYAEMATIRSDVSGFVDKVFVTNGQFVSAGVKLLEVRNELVEQEYYDILRQIDQCHVRHKMAVDQQLTAEAQIQRRKLVGLTQRLAQVEKQFNGLTVYSRNSGRIVARQLHNQVGAYVTEGQELVSIGQEDKKEIKLSVGQREANVIDPQIGQPVAVRIGSRRKTLGMLTQLNPRASTEISHPALANHVGGRIAVQEKPQPADEKNMEWEFVEPRFLATVSLSPEESSQLFAGETGYALIRWKPESLGVAVRQGLSDWIRSKLDATRASRR